MTTNTNTEEFDPTIALDFTDDPYVDEDADYFQQQADALWAEYEEDRNDNDDTASAWGF